MTHFFLLRTATWTRLTFSIVGLAFLLLTSPLALAEVAFFGRDYDTYKNMFCLADEDLKEKRILDVASGPSTFLGDLKIKGWLHSDSRAVDLAYRTVPEVERSIEQGMKQAFFPMYDGSIQQWPTPQQESMIAKHKNYTIIHESFLAYYQKFPELYLQGDLRKLPQLFDKKPKFDRIYSANLLFLYSEKEKELDEAFHEEAILRMTEVLEEKGELRIFPLDGFKATTSPFLNSLIDTLRNKHHLVVQIKDGCAPSTGQLMNRMTEARGKMLVIHKNN